MDVPYKLYKGDCLEIMPTLEAGSVDAIITDLPYGTTQNAWDSIIPLAPMWEQVKRILKPNGVFVTTASQPFTSILIASNLDFFLYECILEKSYSTGFLDANRRPMKAHENICVFGKSITYNPQMIKGESHKRGGVKKWDASTDSYGDMSNRKLTNSNLWYPTSIIKSQRDPEASVTLSHRPNKQERHPTQKSVLLYEYLIRTYTNPNELVLDFCMGSGTTIVSSIQSGRRSIGIEKESKYFALAKKRAQSAQAPLFVEASTQPNKACSGRGEVSPKLEGLL